MRHLDLAARSILLCAAVVALSSRDVKAQNIVETAVKAGKFNTLATALKSADLVKALSGEGPFTVFAPTDAAFAKLPQGTVDTLLKPENREKLKAILTYHVVAGAVPAKQVVHLEGAKTLNGQRVDIQVDGGKVTVDGATVVTTDVRCSNGIIHVIDSVLLPATDDIPQTAEKAGKFHTLLAAVRAAGLEGVLAGDGPFTLFAPRDDAFARLPEGTVESLLQPENRLKLTEILKYHLVEGRVYSDDALRAGEAVTLQGNSIHVGVDSGKARVNSATLLATDIDASNGVIHVIDAVLMPSEKKISAAEAMEMIDQAIARGVPLFNSGHHSACAAVYMTTMRELIKRGDNLPHGAVTRLTSAVEKGARTHSPSKRAWTLRHGLDNAYHAMSR